MYMMNVKVEQMLQVSYLRLIRKFSTKFKVKVEVEIEPAVEEAINSKALRPKDSPGKMKQQINSLPKPLLESITTILKGRPDQKYLFENSTKLVNKLRSRHPPAEKRDIAMKSSCLQLSLEKDRPYSLPDLDESDKNKVLEVEETVLRHEIQKFIGRWAPMDQSELTCLQYLIARTPPEFVVLHKIFSEIAIRDYKFKPSTFFDFGSGVGSGFWAAKTVWQKNFTEVFNVDSNVHMNDLAALLLRGGNKQATLAPGIFFRQFLPALPNPTYDIVLCAYTLLDLPSMQHRIETLLTLWAKTETYLIIVEQGTNAGYKMVIEARDVILRKELKKSSEGDEDVRNVHVFAPCPHDMLCPHFGTDNTPCNFSVRYNSSLTSSDIFRSEVYSYVVLKKGPRSEDERQWPRCVRETQARKGHVHCTLCTSDGKLSKVILTKSKHSRAAYALARSSDWGDLLPGKVFVKTVEDGEAAGEDADGDQKTDIETESSKT